MRGFLVLAVVGACGFPRSPLGVVDAERRDVPRDISVGWAVDATSKKGVPANAAEWTLFAQSGGLTIAAPDHLWLMQEMSGNLTDYVGNAPLMQQSGPMYGVGVVGWNRLAVGTYEAVTNEAFYTTAAGNLNGPSFLFLVYVAVGAAPMDERSLFGIGLATDHRFVSITTTPVFKGTGNGVTSMLGSVNPMMAVHPVLIAINATQRTYRVYTDQEKIQIGWTDTTGQGALVTIGNSTTLGAASARYLYGALWQGANAELSDAEIKELLENLGWTVSGY